MSGNAARWGGLSLLLAVGCVGTQKATPIMGPAELKGRYERYWKSMQPADETTRYDRPLFQLGLPGEDRLVVWLGSANPGVTADIYRFRLCQWTEQGCAPDAMRDVGSGEAQATAFNPWNTARVELSGAGGQRLQPDTEYDIEVLGRDGGMVSRLTARTAPRAGAPTRPFSFLVFSCNKPFSGLDQAGNYRSVAAFTASHLNSWNLMRLRSEGRLSARTRLDEASPAVLRPSFAIGLGDQIYTDPDNPSSTRLRRSILKQELVLAFFVGDSSNYWMVSNERSDLQAELKEVYYRNFALPPVDAVARRVPFVLAWDDHEIRDGWGSQEGGRAEDSPWPLYFAEAQASFKAFQFSRGPGLDERPAVEPAAAAASGQYDCEDRGDMDFAYDWGRGVHFFVMDTRSSRDARRKCVISSAQLQRLRSWLARNSSGQGDLFVLANNAPLGARLAKSSPLYTQYKRELRDDVADSWIQNRPALHALAEILMEHFDKNQRDRLIILSGDVHESGLYSLKLDSRRIGWEVVSSGVANYSSYSDASSLGTIGSNSDCLDTKGRLCPEFYGSIKGSPSFAEIIVAPEQGSASLVFYPSVADPSGPGENHKGTSNHLINLVPELGPQEETPARNYWTLYAEWARSENPPMTRIESRGPVIVPLLEERLQVPSSVPEQVWIHKRGYHATFSPFHDAMSEPRSSRREDENASHWFEVFAP